MANRDVPNWKPGWGENKKRKSLDQINKNKKEFLEFLKNCDNRADLLSKAKTLFPGFYLKTKKGFFSGVEFIDNTLYESILSVLGTEQIIRARRDIKNKEGYFPDKRMITFLGLNKEESEFLLNRIVEIADKEYQVIYTKIKNAKSIREIVNFVKKFKIPESSLEQVMQGVIFYSYKDKTDSNNYVWNRVSGQDLAEYINSEIEYRVPQEYGLREKVVELWENTPERIEERRVEAETERLRAAEQEKINKKQKERDEELKRIAKISFTPEDGKIISNEFIKQQEGWVVCMVMNNANWTNGLGRTKAEAMLDAKRRIIEKDYDHNEYENYSEPKENEEDVEVTIPRQRYRDKKEDIKIVNIKKSKGKFIEPYETGPYDHNIASEDLRGNYSRMHTIKFDPNHMNHYNHMAEVTMDDGTYSYGFGKTESQAVEDAKSRIESGQVETNLDKWTVGVD